MKTIQFTDGTSLECPVLYRATRRIKGKEYETLSLYFDPAKVDYDALRVAVSNEDNLYLLVYTNDAVPQRVPQRVVQADGSAATEYVTAEDVFDHYMMLLGIGEVDSRLNEALQDFDSPQLYKVELGRIDEAEQAVVAYSGQLEQVRTAFAANASGVTDALTLACAPALKVWEDVLNSGGTLVAGEPFTHKGQAYRAVTDVTPQAHQEPGGEGMLAVYRPLDESHAGTRADPIHFRPGMACMKEQYYTYGDVLYRCTRDYEGGTGHTPDVLVGHFFEIVEG